jgi:hypothetical protein
MPLMATSPKDYVQTGNARRQAQTGVLQIKRGELKEAREGKNFDILAQCFKSRPRNHTFFPINIDRNAPAKRRVCITCVSIFVRMPGHGRANSLLKAI